VESIIESYYIKSEERWSDVPTEGAELRYIVNHPEKGLMDIDEFVLLIPNDKNTGWVRKYDLGEILLKCLSNKNLDKFVDYMEISQMKELLKSSASSIMEEIS